MRNLFQMRITLVHMRGTRSEVFRDAIHIAETNRCRVLFDYNGIDLEVVGTDTIKDTDVQYIEALEANKSCYGKIQNC